MSEEQIQLDLQIEFREMDEFAKVDVVINDYAPFDISTIEAPYAIIENSDEVISNQDGYTANTTWNIPVILIVRFMDHKDTSNDFRDKRQALVDKFNSDGFSFTNDGTRVANLRTETPILEWYDPYVPDNQRAEAYPVFLFQRLIFVVEEF